MAVVRYMICKDVLFVHTFGHRSLKTIGKSPQMQKKELSNIQAINSHVPAF